MAMDEITKPADKDTLYAQVNGKSRTIINKLNELKSFADWIGNLTGANLTTLQVPASEQTKLAGFRTAVNELLSCFEGNAVTPTTSIREVMEDCLRF